MTKKSVVRTSTKGVTEYRARQAKAGSATVYTIVDAETVEALDNILHRKLCTRREAVETSIKRYAHDLTRARKG